MKVRLVAAALLFVQSYAEFTPHFNNFLKLRYGEKTRSDLERLDLGPGPLGSFGGKISDLDQKSGKRALVFVHGVTLRALAFVAHREFFLKKGYALSDMYATSYGDGGLTMALDTPIKCEYIKQVRQMIMAAHEYTGKVVDVIAWSMGSAIARKAILGGKCTETDEWLGFPLTPMIDTFTATGGANNGIQLCPKRKKACNPYNSMHCASVLMHELNSQPFRYEGKNSYSIYTLADTIIGRMCCGKVCGELKNANASIEKPHLNHLTIFSETLSLQYKLINH